MVSGSVQRVIQESSGQGSPRSHYLTGIQTLRWTSRWPLRHVLVWSSDPPTNSLYTFVQIFTCIGPKTPSERLVQTGCLLQLFEIGIAQPLKVLDLSALRQVQWHDLFRGFGKVDHHLARVQPWFDGANWSVMRDR